MHLVTDAEVDALASQLTPSDDLSIASIDVGFDPFDFARTGALLVDRAVALSTPTNERLAGLGTAWRAVATGADRFGSLRDQLAAIGRPDLRAFVGFSFLPDGPTTEIWDGYEAAEVFVPRITIEGNGGGTRITVAVPHGDRPEPTLELLASMRKPTWIAVDDTGDHSIESHPHVTDYASSVATAIDAINAGKLEKVVLARSVIVNSSEPVAILRVFRQLAQRYPQCYNFAWKSGDTVFMGASPELLADVRGSAVRSNPLAGSTRRGEGQEDDLALGESLMASAKDREEHRLVVDDLAERLGPLTSSLEVPTGPVLKKMATVQHLSTEISGTLDAGYGVMDVVDAVHPTPAVGGVAREDAVSFIDRTEQIDRGWYTGGIGWMNGAGDGAIAIGLRCGIVHEGRTQLFAGAGIVADSRPDAELKETRLKLRPLLDVLATS
ncbi:MAG: isochorismate synthase [Actinomycetota bacterium]